MKIFLTVNVTNEEDTSGLPQYYRSLINNLIEDNNKDFFIIDVSTNENYNEGIIEYNGITLLRLISKNFLNKDPFMLDKLMGGIASLNEQIKIDEVIYPDYLFVDYLDTNWLSQNKIIPTLFIHLLNRGMLNTSSKQKYSVNNEISLDYLTNSSLKEWVAVTSSEKIICNSFFTKRDLIRYYQEDLTNQEVLATQLGVDKKMFNFKFNNNGKFMFFGRISAQKGIYYIVSDISKNIEKYKENPIIVAGEGELESGLIKAWFYDKTVNFVGNLQRKELIEQMDDVTFCIFPSIYEPWGLAVNEAMAKGKICIVQSGASGMTEQIKDGVDGFHFDFKSDSIINFIEKLNNEHKMELKKIAKKARENARDFKDHFNDLNNLLW